MADLEMTREGFAEARRRKEFARARTMARRRFNVLQKRCGWRVHFTSLAHEALEYAEHRMQYLGTHGAWEHNDLPVIYLDAGGPDELTLLFHIPSKQFRVGTWGSYDV